MIKLPKHTKTSLEGMSGPFFALILRASFSLKVLRMTHGHAWPSTLVATISSSASKENAQDKARKQRDTKSIQLESRIYLKHAFPTKWVLPSPWEFPSRGPDFVEIEWEVGRMIPENGLMELQSPKRIDTQVLTCFDFQDGLTSKAVWFWS